LDRDVGGDGRVAEATRVYGDRHAPSDHRPAPLELVYREVDAPHEQVPERPFHAVVPDETL
jgi:hypothetical protein